MLIRSKNGPMEIPISSIAVNPGQPRKVFPDQELDELSNSIREFGVIQPIIVKKSGSQYILIAGERRVRASTLAGLEKIPAIIRDANEKDMAFIALIENVQRENLNYLEEAMAYKHFMDEYGMTQSEISKRVGKQQSTISNKIRLLSLPEEMREALIRNQLTERHARAILRITDGEQRKQILERIIDHSLNVRQSEKLIDDFLKKTEDERRKAEKLRFINYRIYINTIKNAFNTIHEVEEGAKYYQEDKGDHLELRILIPKKAG
ncbi:MAG: ParB/RepB/Spo0J family partition protein [Anaerovoracaceae bacterium]